MPATAFIDIGTRLDSSSLSRLERDIDNFVRRNSRSVNMSLRADSFSAPLGRISASVKDFDKSLDAANQRVIAFAASAGILYGIQRGFRELVSSIVEVDLALREVNVLFGLSNKQLQVFGSQLFDIAKKTGQSFNVVAEAATELARQGLSVEETLKRTRDALALTRLSGLDAGRSVETITAALNGFNESVLDSTQLVSKLAAVDSAFAVSSRDLAEAIRRVGVTAQDSGVSLDELLGLVTAVQQRTARGGANIGEAFKTIFTRVNRPGVLDQLEALGVTVRDLNREALPTTQILQNLANNFGQLAPSAKSAVAEIVGGVYRINILRAALGDVGSEFSNFKKATDIAAGASDEAIVRIEQLNKSISDLANTAANNFKKLGANLGGGLLEPSIRFLLGSFNNISDVISNVTGTEEESKSAGQKFATGFVKGFGESIKTIGLLGASAALFKVGQRFFEFAKGDIKSLLGLNRAAVEQEAAQKRIADIIQGTPALYDRVINKNITLLELQRKILTIIQAQGAAQSALAAPSGVLASQLLQRGNIVVDRRGEVAFNTTNPKPRRTLASGYIPQDSPEAIAEKMGAVNGGYIPGKIQTTNIQGLGRVVYNDAEEVRDIGLSQPAIIPPRSSKAGREYRQKFKQKIGYDPYMSEGYIPDLQQLAKDKGFLGPIYKGYYPFDINNKQPIRKIQRQSSFPTFSNEPDIDIAGFFSSSQAVARQFAFGTEGIVNPFYAKFKKPYIINAKGDFAGKIQFGKTGTEFREAVRSKEYDGVIIKNTRDEGDVFVSLDSRQTKLALPKTFDQSGKIIPISRRLDDRIDDFNFSSGYIPNYAPRGSRYLRTDQVPIDPRGIVGQLSDIEKRAYIAKHAHQMSDFDIAKALKISVESVPTILANAQKNVDILRVQAQRGKLDYSGGFVPNYQNPFGEETNIDYFNRHDNYQKTKDGKIVFYHGIPKNRIKIARESGGLREGSLLTSSPELAKHYASRDRGYKESFIKVIKMELDPNDVNKGIFPSLKNPYKFSSGLIPNYNLGERRFDSISQYLNNSVKKPLSTLSSNDFADSIQYLSATGKEDLNRDLKFGGFGGAFPFGRKKTGSVAELLRRRNYQFDFNGGLIPNFNIRKIGSGFHSNAYLDPFSNVVAKVFREEPGEDPSARAIRYKRFFDTAEGLDILSKIRPQNAPFNVAATLKNKDVDPAFLKEVFSRFGRDVFFQKFATGTNPTQAVAGRYQNLANSYIKDNNPDDLLAFSDIRPANILGNTIIDLVPFFKRNAANGYTPNFSPQISRAQAAQILKSKQFQSITYTKKSGEIGTYNAAQYRVRRDKLVGGQPPEGYDSWTDYQEATGHLVLHSLKQGDDSPAQFRRFNLSGIKQIRAQGQIFDVRSQGLIPNFLDTSLLKAFRATKNSIAKGGFEFRDLSEYRKVLKDQGITGSPRAVYDSRDKSIRLSESLVFDKVNDLIPTIAHEGVHKTLDLADRGDNSATSLRGRLAINSLDFDLSEPKTIKRTLDSYIRTVGDYPPAAFLEESLADGSLRKPGDTRILNKYLGLTNRQIDTSNKLYYRLRKAALQGLKVKGFDGGLIPNYAKILGYHATTLNFGKNISSEKSFGEGQGRGFYAFNKRKDAENHFKHIEDTSFGGLPQKKLVAGRFDEKYIVPDYETHTKEGLEFLKNNQDLIKNISPVQQLDREGSPINSFLEKFNFHERGVQFKINRPTGTGSLKTFGYGSDGDIYSGSVLGPLFDSLRRQYPEKVRSFELDLIKNKGVAFRYTGPEVKAYQKNLSNGLIPNFNAILGYPPLQKSLKREMAAGLTPSQIRIGDAPELKSSTNPLGLAVYNTRDEPLGLRQGIRRYAAMGLDPKKAGTYADGHVPNFAPPFESTFGVGREFGSSNPTQISRAALQALNDAVNLFKAEIRGGIIGVKDFKNVFKSLNNTLSAFDGNVRLSDAATKKVSSILNSTLRSTQSRIKARGGFTGNLFEPPPPNVPSRTFIPGTQQVGSTQILYPQPNVQYSPSPIQGVSKEAEVNLRQLTLAERIALNQQRLIREGKISADKVRSESDIRRDLTSEVAGTRPTIASPAIEEERRETQRQLKEKQRDAERLKKIRVYLNERAGRRVRDEEAFRGFAQQTTGLQERASGLFFGGSARRELEAQLKDPKLSDARRGLLETAKQNAEFKRQSKFTNVAIGGSFLLPAIAGGLSEAVGGESLSARRTQGVLGLAGGAASGALIGATFGPIGAALGGTVGALGPLITLLKEWNNVLPDVTRNFEKLTESSQVRLQELQQLSSDVEKILSFKSGAINLNEGDLNTVGRSVLSRTKFIDNEEDTIEFLRLLQSESLDDNQQKELSRILNQSVDKETRALRFGKFGNDVAGLFSSKNLTKITPQQLESFAAAAGDFNIGEGINAGQIANFENQRKLVQAIKQKGTVSPLEGLAAIEGFDLKDIKTSFSKDELELLTSNNIFPKDNRGNSLVSRLDKQQVARLDEIIAGVDANFRNAAETFYRQAGVEDKNIKNLVDELEKDTEKRQSFVELLNKLNTDRKKDQDFFKTRAQRKQSLSFRAIGERGELRLGGIDIERQNIESTFGLQRNILRDKSVISLARQESGLFLPERLAQIQDINLRRDELGLDRQLGLRQIINNARTGAQGLGVDFFKRSQNQNLSTDIQGAGIEPAKALESFISNINKVTSPEGLEEETKKIEFYLKQLIGLRGEASKSGRFSLAKNYDNYIEGLRKLINGTREAQNNLKINIDSQTQELENQLLFLQRNRINDLTKKYNQGGLFKDEFLGQTRSVRTEQIKERASQGKLNFGELGGEINDSVRDAFTYRSQDLYKDLLEGSIEFTDTFRSGIRGAFNEFITGAASAEDALRNLGVTLGTQLLNKSFETVSNQLFGQLFGAQQNGGQNLLNQGISAIGSLFRNGGAVRGYAGGGMVYGGSGINDDIPSMLQNGSYVLRKSAVNKYGRGFLDSLSGRSRFASGGSARVLLTNQFDAPLQPKSFDEGKFNVSPELSTLGQTDENNPQNINKFQREQAFFNYVKNKQDALKQFERAKKQRLQGAYLNAALAGISFGIGQFNLGGSKPTGYASELANSKGQVVGYELPGRGAYTGNIGYSLPSNFPDYNGSFGLANGGYIKKYALGGYNRDVVPAFLMGGEYVVNKQTVDRYGPGFFNRLNAGLIPNNVRQYALGGPVGNVFGVQSQSYGSSGTDMIGKQLEVLESIRDEMLKNQRGNTVTSTSPTNNGQSGDSINNNVTISITVNRDGSVSGDNKTDSQSDKSRDNTENYKQFANTVQTIVIKEIIKQKQDGGLLAKAR